MACSARDEYSYYELSGLAAEYVPPTVSLGIVNQQADYACSEDYVVESPLSAHTFKLNICQPVKSELWCAATVSDPSMSLNSSVGIFNI
jgi:hypothetical protein